MMNYSVLFSITIQEFVLIINLLRKINPDPSLTLVQADSSFVTFFSCSLFASAFRSWGEASTRAVTSASASRDSSTRSRTPSPTLTVSWSSRNSWTWWPTRPPATTCTNAVWPELQPPRRRGRSSSRWWPPAWSSLRGSPINQPPAFFQRNERGGRSPQLELACVLFYWIFFFYWVDITRFRLNCWGKW